MPFSVLPFFLAFLLFLLTIASRFVRVGAQLREWQSLSVTIGRCLSGGDNKLPAASATAAAPDTGSDAGYAAAAAAAAAAGPPRDGPLGVHSVLVAELDETAGVACGVWHVAVVIFVLVIANVIAWV